MPLEASKQVVLCKGNFYRYWCLKSSVVEDCKQLKCSLLDTRYINFLPLASREIHMATLAFCNHTIITTTTFSWWIGYLAGGEVLYYKDWPKRNSVLDREVVKEDYFLSSWIGLS